MGALVPLFVRDAVGLVGLFAVGLAGADGERLCVELSVIDEAEVGLDFTCEEELVRGREEGERAAPSFDDSDAVASFKRDGVLVGIAAESVLLPGTGGIAPDDAGVVVDGEASQTGEILVSDGLLFGLGDGFLAQQISATVDREAQVAGEDAQRKPGVGDLETRALGADGAGGGVVGGPGAADLFGLAGQLQTAGARHHEGRVPEGVPLFLFDDLGRDLNLQSTQRGGLLLRETAHTAGDLEFGREAAAEDDPVAGTLSYRQLVDGGLAAAYRELGA
jgi:hypothetical protein